MRLLLLVCILLFSNCKTEQPMMDIQGHRGCRGLLPENTIPAFERAIEMGVTTIELDLAISKDKKVVVSHEPFMNHEIALDPYGNEIPESQENSYNLYEMTYDSIQLYDCGTKVHPRFPNQKKLKVSKPLLMDVIDMAEAKTNKTIQYNIEIKSLPEYDGIYSPTVDEFVRLALEVIKLKEISNRTFLQSFDVRALESVHQQAPKIQTALLVDENESIEQKLSQLTFQPNIISPYFELLNASNVKKYHKENFRIIPWTLNDETDIDKMLDMKVDGIISDYPDKLLRLYRERH